MFSDRLLECHADLVYFTSGPDAMAFVMVALGGLVLFWILGGVIFWTVRWIRRGFAGSGKL